MEVCKARASFIGIFNRLELVVIEKDFLFLFEPTLSGENGFQQTTNESYVILIYIS